MNADPDNWIDVQLDVPDNATHQDNRPARREGEPRRKIADSLLEYLEMLTARHGRL